MKKKEEFIYCAYYSQCPNKNCLRNIMNSERDIKLLVEYKDYRPDKNGKCIYYLE